MKKKVIALLLIFASLSVCAFSHAQGFRFGVRRCRTNAIYRVARARTTYVPFQSNTGAVCNAETCNFDVPEITFGPCEATSSIPQVCGAVEQTSPAPCDAAQFIEEEQVAPCDPACTDVAVPPCGSVEIASVSSPLCPTGICPLRTALSVPRNVVRAVAETVALARINALRARAGAGPVVLDDSLTDGCVAHSVYMSRLGRLSHASGYPEIIAQNGSGMEFAVVNQWARSAGHYQIMTGRQYTRVGLGLYRDSSGRCWCTARFQ